MTRMKHSWRRVALEDVRAFVEWEAEWGEEDEDGQNDLAAAVAEAARATAAREAAEKALRCVRGAEMTPGATVETATYVPGSSSEGEEEAERAEEAMVEEEEARGPGRLEKVRAPEGLEDEDEILGDSDTPPSSPSSVGGAWEEVEGIAEGWEEVGRPGV